MGRAERRAWRIRAAETAPVFIVGEPRSGTSILFRSLQSHPAFLPAAGVHLAESQASNLLLLALGPEAGPDVAPLAVFSQSAEGWASFLEDVQDLEGRRRWVRRVAGAARLSHKLVWLAAGEHHVLRRYFLEAHARRGAPRLLDKSPMHLPWVPHLGAAFPDARFLYIVRHPIEVFSSYRRRFAVDPVASAWANIDETEFCDGWSTRTRRADAIARRDPRLMVLRYEDFTRDTEDVVRRVLDHVGEPFDPACLLSDDDESRQFAIDPHLFGQLVTTTKQWRDHVDEDCARRIEQRLAADMARLRYEPMFAEGQGE